MLQRVPVRLLPVFSWIPQTPPHSRRQSCCPALDPLWIRRRCYRVFLCEIATSFLQEFLKHHHTEEGNPVLDPLWIWRRCYSVFLCEIATSFLQEFLKHHHTEEGNPVLDPLWIWRRCYSVFLCEIATSFLQEFLKHHHTEEGNPVLDPLWIWRRCYSVFLWEIATSFLQEFHKHHRTVEGNPVLDPLWIWRRCYSVFLSDRRQFLQKFLEHHGAVHSVFITQELVLRVGWSPGGTHHARLADGVQLLFLGSRHRFASVASPEEVAQHGSLGSCIWDQMRSGDWSLLLIFAWCCCLTSAFCQTLLISCDMIERNESDVGDIGFEILAKTVFKFFVLY